MTRMLRKLRLHADDRGSMPMALLVITIGLSLSAAIAPVVIRQFTSTRNLVSRNVALNAAQAGMDVMMARVRAASNDDLSGLLENLPPCTLTGDAGVGGVGEKLTYQVTVQYRDQDGDPITCPVSEVPVTAIVTSKGGGGARGATRTLTATYIFTTSNTNIPGGQIKIDTSTLGDQCIDAGSSKSPPTGTKITMSTCDGGSSQQFGYTSDLYLKLVYSESSSAPYGMCLTTGTSTHSNSSIVSFAPCPAATRQWDFQWALDGSSKFHPALTGNSTDNNYCMSLMSPNGVDSLVGLNNCSTVSSRNIWRSTTGVGAGMAGDATAQLVNYAQFSRCFDVTNQDPNASYMIAWFCKQSPNGVVDWNQQWVHPVPSPPAISATGNIIVTRSGTPYCLKSPGTSTLTSYPTVVACTATNKPTAAFQWTVFHDTGDYGTSYRIQDSSGFCLTPTDQNATPRDVHSDGTSKIRMAVCNSSELQKWNAPPNVNKPTPLTDLSEK